MRHERAIPIEAEIEVRSTDGGHSFSGYAAVFGAESRPLPYIETVEPGAFARSLGNPPGGRQTFVIDHDTGRLIAATDAGDLHLSEDGRGLLVEAELRDVAPARDLREHYEAGHVRGMSFEFSATAKGAPFVEDGKRRRLREAKLFHVTALMGKTAAYPATTAEVRALANVAGVDFASIDLLLDAIREGRQVDDEEWGAVARILDHLRPEWRAPSIPMVETRATPNLDTARALFA